MNRHLDGVYFRIRKRGRPCNLCFSDLTRDEKEEVLKDKEKAFLKNLCIILAEKLKEIGDLFDILCDDDDDEEDTGT